MNFCLESSRVLKELRELSFDSEITEVIIKSRGKFFIKGIFLSFNENYSFLGF